MKRNEKQIKLKPKFTSNGAWMVQSDKQNMINFTKNWKAQELPDTLSILEQARLRSVWFFRTTDGISILQSRIWELSRGPFGAFERPFLSSRQLLHHRG